MAETRAPRPPVATDPIPEGFFRVQLQRYPVVRNKNYVGPENLPQRAVVPKLKNTAAPRLEGGYAGAASAAEFWTALQAFLDAHYAAADARTIQRQFEKAHFEFLNGLCLEDLEDLAALIEADDGAETSDSATVGAAVE